MQKKTKNKKWGRFQKRKCHRKVWSKLLSIHTQSHNLFKKKQQQQQTKNLKIKLATSTK